MNVPLDYWTGLYALLDVPLENYQITWDYRGLQSLSLSLCQGTLIKDGEAGCYFWSLPVILLIPSLMHLLIIPLI